MKAFGSTAHFISKLHRREISEIETWILKKCGQVTQRIKAGFHSG
jgi:hypothetical protein